MKTRHCSQSCSDVFASDELLLTKLTGARLVVRKRAAMLGREMVATGLTLAEVLNSIRNIGEKNKENSPSKIQQ